ncbi:MAG: sigma-70 family RNA polymerase sigma factor [Clostridia bacterium]|nr:sigma-70 family RNA polymerase sigma factor [Clostridia bacterium]
MHGKAQELYRRHRTAVYHLALSYLKDRSAAEDVLQDVFVALLEAEQPVRHPRAWLLTATRSRCLNMLRDTRFETVCETLPETVCDGGQEDALFVEQMLGLLSAEERQAFALHHLDGFRYREIAEGLELPIGTVQSRCRAARQKLKEALANEEKRLVANTGKEKRV